jgi:TolB-like protein/tetratricopeptide (TPR) repeat protein
MRRPPTTCQGTVPPVSESSHAVFLSYASEDAPAALRIAEALRAASIEVWFDQSELRGGDIWDQRIRSEIRDCALFIPIVSRHTQERLEGYFRREWKLAIERTHDMAEQKHFLVPVVVDSTGDRDAIVPDLFRAVQWTRLPQGETPPAFVDRVKRLLSPEASTTIRPSASPQSGAGGTNRTSARVVRSLKKGPLVALAVLILAAVAYLAIDRVWIRKLAVTSPTVAAGVAAFSPPPHSVAVLPFINMSGDKEQEYFSEGLTEELLNSLAEINGLQVAARTSAFSFQGKDIDLGTIAHKLNVGAILEGSVRRSGHTVRITAQLINAVTGFHVWSKTYDRDLGDVLQLQTEIATAVAEALKVTLLGDVSAKIELAGTRNPAAFDAYLRGLKLARIAAATTPMECQAPVDAFTEAITLDPNFALAYANRALITSECAGNSRGWLQQPNEGAGRADAERAIALAPSLADGYVALSRIEQGSLKLEAADQACVRALALGPGNVWVLYDCSLLAVFLGHADTAIATARHGVALDPLNPLSHRALGDTLRYARRYEEAIAAYQASIATDPEHSVETYALRGLSYYLAGNLSSAQSSCEAMPEAFRNRVCRAVIYDRLGRHADAAAVVAKIMQGGGDAAAYQYAEIFAQWGDRKAALDWLERAMRLRDPGLVYTKVDPLLDPLRKEPRFQAVMQELQFPK